MSLKKKDPSLRVAANDPHLVSLGGGRLSTAVTIHYIPVGDTTIGSSTTCSISLNGSGVRQTHCTIYRSEENEVTIVPEMDARILIDGTKVNGETNLTQGAMITIGNSNYLRFNNPAEAQLIRSAMGSNERISMPQIDFTQVQRNSDRSSNSMGGAGGSGGGGGSCGSGVGNGGSNAYRQSIEIEAFYESKINPKLLQHHQTDTMTNEISKTANYEKQQQNATTKKTTAGNNGSSCSIGFDINGWQCPKVFTADLVTVNTPAKDVLGPKYANFARNLAENHRNEKNINNHMTSLKGTTTVSGLSPAEFIQNTSYNTGGGGGGGGGGSMEFLTKVNNVSPSVGRVTNTNQAPHPHPPHPHNYHNTIPAYDRYPKPGTYGGLQLFPMNGVNTEINNSSSSSSSSSPSIQNSHITSNNHSYEVSPNRSNSSFCNRIEQQQQQQHLPKNLSNISLQECERVDEILKMCTEYDRQNQSITSSPIVQNRIKTNGSLPREKKTPFSHDLSSPQNHSSSLSSSNHQQKAFFPEKSKPPPAAAVPSSSGYENVRLINERRMEMGSPKIGYENVVVGKYVPQSPRTKIRTTCMSPKKDSPFNNSFAHLNHHSQQQQPKFAHSPCEYEQLIQTFEEKLKMEMEAIEECSKFKPLAASVDNSPTKRSNKNINNLTLDLNVDVTNSNSSVPSTAKLKEEGEMNVEKLKKTRKEIVRNIQKLKSQITELQKQEDEVLRELDLEEALVSAELSSVGDSVDELEKSLAILQNKIHRHEAQRNATRVMEENQQAKLKQSIEMKQDQLAKLKTMLKSSPNDEYLKEELHNISDSLDNDRKTFEDLEFQYLEEESEWQAYREELHMDAKNLSMKIDEKRIEMHHLEKQEYVTQKNSSTDAKSIRDRLIKLLNNLQKNQEELREIENVICEITGQLPLESSEPLSISDEDVEEDANSSSDKEKSIESPTNTERIGVMSQSLFGSAELLCPKRNIEDLMSKSVNENLFFNNKIELPPAQATSTPIRQKLKVFDIIDESVTERRSSLPQITELQNSSPVDTEIPIDDDKKSDNSLLRLKITTTSESKDHVNFNLTLGNDDFEVNPLEKRIPSQDDIDRICKVTTNAPISTKGASTKIFDSIKEIERNRQLLLAQQGHHVIEHERQKMMDLKKKSHDEARAQYLSMLSCSLDSGSPTISKGSNAKEHSQQHENQQQKQLPSEKANHSTDKENQQKNVVLEKNCGDQHQKTSSQNRHSQPELESQRSRPLSEANSEQSCDLLSTNTYKSNIDISLATDSNGGGNAVALNSCSTEQSSDDAKRASVNSNETTSGSERLTSGNKRSLPKHQRPLTRYLPIFSPDLNLRHHIESAGHQITLCPHVFVDAYSCRGYLHKLGATFRSWARRWFVLDRQRNAFIYYSDKSERKPRGGAYFSTIDEVYLDHLNASKSGRPHCTFIVKTKKRSYHLQAASDAAARIWIDAIITGAQGNVDY